MHINTIHRHDNQSVNLLVFRSTLVTPAIISLLPLSKFHCTAHVLSARAHVLSSLNPFPSGTENAASYLLPSPPPRANPAVARRSGCALPPWSSNITCDLPPDAKVSFRSPSSWPADLAGPGHDAARSCSLTSSPHPIGARRHSSGPRRSSLVLSPFGPLTSYAMYRPLPEAPPHPSGRLMSSSRPLSLPLSPSCTRICSCGSS